MQGRDGADVILVRARGNAGKCVKSDAVLALERSAGNGGAKEIYGGSLTTSTPAREIIRVQHPSLDLRHLPAK